MGFLPLHPADWVAYVDNKIVREWIKIDGFESASIMS